MEYRLGLDVGTNSIGWVALDLGADGEPCGLRALGVRIFPDGRDAKSHASLAVDRRVARGARRRRDRYLKRRQRLLEQLINLGLMPEDEKARKDLERLDPYKLRKRAADKNLKPLTPHELGRALFHLSQRRGFKSNRKTDAAADEKESQGIQGGISRLGDELKDRKQTLGAYQAQRLARGEPARFKTWERPKGKEAEKQAEKRGEETGEGFYPSRAMYDYEFKKIQEVQTALTEKDWKELHETIFHQRPLRPVDPGKCTLNPSEQRAPKALLLAQRFRMLQDLSNLGVQPDKTDRRNISQRPLTPEERTLLLKELEHCRLLKFTGLRKKLGLASDAYVNFDDGKRQGLKGNETACLLAHRQAFGKAWFDLSSERQNEIVECLLEEEDTDAIERKAREEWGLEEEAAKKVARLHLPQGHLHYGRTALGELVLLMGKHGVRLEEAIKECGYSGMAALDGEADSLSYYGKVLERYTAGGGRGESDELKWGRIANPTVHIGLNQLRRVVNALIGRFGKPAEIVVELARDLKQSAEARKEEMKRQAGNERANEERKEQIRKTGGKVTGHVLRKLRLWEEQGPPDGRCCPFCGVPINFTDAMTAATEIEHILPFSRSLDDGMANKVLAHRACNRDKGNRTPYEAFHDKPSGHKHAYETMKHRVDAMFRSEGRRAGFKNSKRWRFYPDAMERFKDEEAFLARQLQDTRYLSRVARQYLTEICLEKRVWVTPGRLTALLRGKWGLSANTLLRGANEPDLEGEERRTRGKDRSDHRHHAVDALVVALTSRSALQKVSTAAARAEEQELDKIVDDLPPPWKGFDTSEVQKALRRVVVSHRPKRPPPGKNIGRQRQGRDRTTGTLHNATAYGLVNKTDGEGREAVTHEPESYHGEVVSRKLLENLKEKDLAGDTIRDVGLRKALSDLWEKTRDAGGDWKDFVSKASEEPEALSAVGFKGAPRGVRSVRVKEKLSGVVVKGKKDRKPYKVYKTDGNAFMDIFDMSPCSGAKGKKWKGWKGVTVTRFDANRSDFDKHYAALRPHPAARRVARLYINDVFALGPKEESCGYGKLFRVQKLSGQRVYYAEPHEADVVGRTTDAKKEKSEAKKAGRTPPMEERSVNTLMEQGFRLVSVDVLGRVSDPGSPAS